ncbi:hypothetical protein Emag_004628 [Eimeria magna]
MAFAGSEDVNEEALDLTSLQISREEKTEKNALALQSPSSLRLPLHLPPDVFATLRLPAHEILHGRNRAVACKVNGWGFKDTYLRFLDAATITLTGNRFLADLLEQAPDVEVSEEGFERLYYGHGHTCEEIFALRHGHIERLPDVVLYPKCHKDVEVIVKCASDHGVCLIPFGGGTSVTLGLAVPEAEERMVATVSLTFMQKILSLDRDALLLLVEAGAVGAVLEEQLKRLGVTLGHEPDSLEFSTVGGWVATRASAPRVSSGPSVQQLILGSEGTLGIITQVLFKVKPIPEVFFTDFSNFHAMLI